MQNLETVAQKMAELPLDAPESPLLMPLTKKKSHNLLRQFIRNSMQYLESVDQKMAELPLDVPDQKKSHNLLRQFIRSSMQNMESVAQKMAELPLEAPEIPLTPLTKKVS